MELEKKLVIAAPAAKVWALLLDPQVMGACVPGTQSVEVLSDVQYLAHIQVKIAFVSARFKIKTTVVETRPPHYLRSEGTGEDASVGSSLKQSSEIFLTELDDGRTELCMKIKVDVLGRLGAFGLNVMKTKADRMWEEFGTNFAARVVPAATPPAPPVEAVETALPQAAVPHAVNDKKNGKEGWWSRLAASASARSARAGEPRQPTDIHIEVRRGDATVTVLWPAQSASECAAWLRDYLK